MTVNQFGDLGGREHFGQRVRFLRRQAPFGLLGAGACAALVGVLYVTGPASTAGWIWLTAFALLTVTRVVQVRLPAPEETDTTAIRRWAALFTLLALASGLMWAIACLAVAPRTGVAAELLTFLVLAGLCAGAVAAYSAFPAAVYSFVGASLVPMIATGASFSNMPTVLTSVALAVFTLVMMATARRQYAAILEAIRLQTANLDLIRTLETAKSDAEALNTTLRAEIAERRRVEADLAQSLTLQQSTMDAVAEGILAVDEDGRLVAANRRFRELWGFSADEVAPGTPLAAIDVRLRAQTAGMTGLQSGPEPTALDSPNTSQGLIALTDGRLFERYSVPYRHQGRIIGRVRTMRDVTARVRTERELVAAKTAAENANRAKSEFLAHISHELRTPLNAILGFAEIFKNEMFGRFENPRYRDYAVDIYDSARMLLSLINDILDLSKVEAGKLELEEVRISLPHLIQSTERLVRERAHDRGVKLTIASTASLPLLQGDERAVKQMLMNLLTNAVKFTEAEGAVVIRAEQRGDGGLDLAVADTGIGMHDDDIPRALEPFGQVDSLLTREHQGSGLGLPLVKGLIEAHGGSLSIVSAPDQGTTVTLSFPPQRSIIPRGRLSGREDPGAAAVHSGALAADDGGQ